MAPIPKLVTGLVKALKNRAKKTHPQNKKEAASGTQITTPLAPTASTAPVTEDLLKGKPFQTNVYVDKSSNTVLRIKIPEANYEKICAQLIQQGDLVREIKKIFLFHNLENRVRLQYDAQNNAVWDILIHTQDKDKQSAILAMLTSKNDLFKLNTLSLDQISPAPKLHPEKQNHAAAKTVIPLQKQPPAQATKTAKAAKPQAAPPLKKPAPAQPTTPAKPAATPPPQKTAAPTPPKPAPAPVPEKTVAAPPAPAPAPEPEKAVAAPPAPAPAPEPEKAVAAPPAPAPAPEPEKVVAAPPAPAPAPEPEKTVAAPPAPAPAPEPEKAVAAPPVPAPAPEPEKVVETQAEQAYKERKIQEQKKYQEYAEKIKQLFPEGSVVVTIKEDEIQLGFATNAALCEVVRKNLDDYKKIDKINSGNNFSLPRSNQLAQLLSDARQDIWKAVFKQYASPDNKKPPENTSKMPVITIKRAANPQKK